MGIMNKCWARNDTEQIEGDTLKQSRMCQYAALALTKLLPRYPIYRFLVHLTAN